MPTIAEMFAGVQAPGLIGGPGAATFGGTPPATGEGRATSSSIGQTYMSQPGITDPIASALANLQQNLAGQYQGLLQNPTASPLFQGQLGPLLQSLIPSEDRARQSLTDTFRAAGGLRSGAYGQSASRLEGDILGNRQEAAGKLLGQAFPQLMQALQNPLSQVTSLIDALKLQQSQSQSQGAYTKSGGGSSGWENIPPSMGLATPMQADRMPTTMSPQQLEWANKGYGGSAQTGVNYPTSGSMTQGTPTVDNSGAYDLLSRVLGGGSGVTYNPVTGAYESAPSSNLGSFTPTQGGYQAPVGGDYSQTDWEY